MTTKDAAREHVASQIEAEIEIAYEHLREVGNSKEEARDTLERVTGEAIRGAVASRG
jgi:hypothetical protein